MRRASFLLIFAVCLAAAAVLSSCTSKQEERSSTAAGPGPANAAPTSANEKDVTAAPAVPLPTNAPVIVTFGDSLTAGVSGRSYPDQLQDLLVSKGYVYRVDNQGVSGDTTTDGLARIDNAIAAHPALLLLEFGGNDGLRGVPVEATRKNLDQMIRRIQAARIPLALLGITLPPNYGPDYVKPFTAIFPTLAREHHIPFLPFLLLHVYQDNNLMQPDGIHPNQDGNRIVAQDVFTLIQPLLKKSSR